LENPFILQLWNESALMRNFWKILSSAAMELKRAYAQPVAKSAYPLSNFKAASNDFAFETASLRWV
jgi:hypothetical protein